MLFRKDVDGMNNSGGYNETKNIIAPSLYAVGDFGLFMWWTSSFSVAVENDGALVCPDYIRDNYSVRAVCAF